MKLNYKIDDMELETIVDDDTKFFFGERVCLSSKFDDMTMNTAWYKD